MVEINVNFLDYLGIRIHKFQDKLQVESYKDAVDEFQAVTDLALDIAEEPRIYEVLKLLNVTLGTMLYLIDNDVQSSIEKKGVVTIIRYDVEQIVSKISSFVGDFAKIH